MAIITNDQFAEFLNNKYSKVLGYNCLPNDDSIFKYNHQALCYELGHMYYSDPDHSDEMLKAANKYDSDKSVNHGLNDLDNVSKAALTLINGSIMTDETLHKAASVLVSKLYNNYQSPFICLFQIAFLFKGLYIHDSLDNDIYNYWFGNELYQFQQALGIAPTDGFLIPQIEVLFSPTYFGMSSDSNQKLYDLQQKLNHFFSNYHTELSLSYGLLAPNGKDYQTSLYGDTHSRTLNNAAIAFQIESGLEPTYWVGQMIGGDLTILDSQLSDLSKEFLVGVLNAYYNIKSTDYDTALADFKSLKNINDTGLSDKTVRSIFTCKLKPKNYDIEFKRVGEFYNIHNNVIQAICIDTEFDQIAVLQNVKNKKKTSAQETNTKGHAPANLATYIYVQKFSDFKKGTLFDKPRLVLSNINGGHTQSIQRASKTNPNLYFIGVHGNHADEGHEDDPHDWTTRVGLIDLSDEGLKAHNNYENVNDIPMIAYSKSITNVKRSEVITSLEDNRFVMSRMDNDTQKLTIYSLDKITDYLHNLSNSNKNICYEEDIKSYLLETKEIPNISKYIGSIQGYTMSNSCNTVYTSSQFAPKPDGMIFSSYPRCVIQYTFDKTPDWFIYDLRNIKSIIEAVNSDDLFHYDSEFATEFEGLQYDPIRNVLYQIVAYHYQGNGDRNVLFELDLSKFDE